MWLIKNPPLGREDIGNKTQYQSSCVLVESFIRAEYTVGLACRAGAWFLRTNTQQRDMNAIHSQLRTACEHRRAAHPPRDAGRVYIPQYFFVTSDRGFDSASGGYFLCRRLGLRIFVFFCLFLVLLCTFFGGNNRWPVRAADSSTAATMRAYAALAEW